MDDIKYARPETLEEAVSELVEFGEGAGVLSGGQSLMPMLRQRLSSYEYIIDINGIEGEEYIENGGGELRFGCLVRHADVANAEAVQDRCAILAEAAGDIGDRQIRNRGTLCGAIAHADPSGDPPVVARALDAEIVALDEEGTNTYDAETFFNGFYETELGDHEIVTEVRFPTVEPPRGAAYEKYEPSAGAYPTATVAAVVELDDGVVVDARAVTGAIEPEPMVMTEAGDHLVDSEPTEERLTEAAELVGENANPMPDSDGSAEFKSEITKTLAKDAFTKAIERAGGESK